MAAQENTPFFFNIDVVGVCNLKCPSCPSGNYEKRINPTGLMELELLERILDKALSECSVGGVGLFNWNEPVLHPKIADLTRAVESRGIPCHLSSNLNKVKDLDALMAANPTGFRISMSGFRQEVYERTHRGGDVEVVKKNMIELARARDAAKATTEIHVLFHRYKTNLSDEQDLRGFAESLGFQFRPVWALFMPLEKILAREDSASVDVTCTAEDLELIGSLALPLDEALEIARSDKVKACALRDQQMTIDVRGNVQLCCAVFDLAEYSLDAFLDHSIAEFQKRKMRHKMCGKCIRHGAHVYSMTSSKGFDEAALANIDPQFHDMILASAAPKKRSFTERLARSFKKRFDRTGGAAR